MSTPDTSAVRAWIRAIIEILSTLDPPLKDASALSDIETAILESAVDWTPAKVLAKRAGYVYGGSFRGVVADMVRRGLLLRGPDGLKRAVVPEN